MSMRCQDRQAVYQYAADSSYSVMQSFPMVRFFSYLQPSKAESLIDSMESGMVTDSSEEQ